MFRERIPADDALNSHDESSAEIHLEFCAQKCFVSCLFYAARWVIVAYVRKSENVRKRNIN